MDCRKISAAHGDVPTPNSPPKIPRVSGPLRQPLLTPARCRCQLQFPEGRPGPAASRSKRRRSRYLPLKSGPEPDWPTPWRWLALRSIRRSPRGLASVHRWAFLKRATAFEQAVRHDAAPRLRHPLSTRYAARVVFASLGSPRAPTHKLCTALDFRSGVDPSERMAL